MTDNYGNEPMVELFVFETTKLLEQLEQLILSTEKYSCFSPTAVNDIFRIMHTVKGSASMMFYENISLIAHSMEDLFFFIRENNPQNIDCSSLYDLIFEGADFIKLEIQKIKNNDSPDGDPTTILSGIKELLGDLKGQNDAENFYAQKSNEDRQNDIAQSKEIDAKKNNHYQAVIFFEKGCEMEHMRAYAVIHSLNDIAQEMCYTPEDTDSDSSAEIIGRDGFKILFKTELSHEDIYDFLMQTPFLKSLELAALDQVEEISHPKILQNPAPVVTHQQSIISVQVDKLDKLMDLVGELVISEAMVTQHPELKNIRLHHFQKAARQLGKITSEIQDMVMSIRMVPIAATFHKMHRILRDMCKKLDKEVELKIIGQETEVDKNIIEHISDPLIHLVRNAIDHGIETPAERQAKGKPPKATVTLEAKNAGSDVVITVKDDGKGLNKEKILQRALANGLVNKSLNEMSDQEIYHLIFRPGFSTKENVTEFSGRGVGMDVVIKNIESVGGSVAIASKNEQGSTITLKLPLTLAIIEGINIKVANSRFTIPTTSIKESFRPTENDLLQDPDGNEMIMVRGQCYPILRLHQLYKIKTEATNITEGIMIMVENDSHGCCIFADELLGEQQVVVKALPAYIKRIKKIKGLAGCTLLGDGSVSLILDIGGLVKTNQLMVGGKSV